MSFSSSITFFFFGFSKFELASRRIFQMRMSSCVCESTFAAETVVARFIFLSFIFSRFFYEFRKITHRANIHICAIIIARPIIFSKVMFNMTPKLIKHIFFFGRFVFYRFVFSCTRRDKSIAIIEHERMLRSDLMKLAGAPK